MAVETRTGIRSPDWDDWVRIGSLMLEDFANYNGQSSESLAPTLDDAGMHWLGNQMMHDVPPITE